jgi:hypothetical protein
MRANGMIGIIVQEHKIVEPMNRLVFARQQVTSSGLELSSDESLQGMPACAAVSDLPFARH